MIIKKCRVCGKEFKAKQSNYVVCSSECRENNRKKVALRYYKNNEAKLKSCAKDYYKNIKHLKIKHVKKHCLICNKELNHGNQTFCLECLIIGDASPNFEYRQMCKHLLWNRGFSSDEIILKRRELINKNGYNYIHLFDNATAGERFSQIIKELGYSNKELSKILYSNCKCISDYRNNKKVISDDFAELIADRFNVSAEWLLNGKE